MKELSSEFFVSGGDGTLLFDSLEEVFNMVAVFVVPSVERLRMGSVGFRWNAAFQSALIKELPELIRIIGFVSKNRSPRKAVDQFECTDQIVAITGCADEAKHAPSSINQSMNLRIRSTSRLPYQLMFRSLRAAEGMFMHFDTGRINRPQLALQPSRQKDVDFVPNAKVAPFSPSSVDRGIGGEDAQGAPTASFTKTKQNRLEDRFYRNRWPSRFSFVSTVCSTRIDQINFFSSLATRRSSLWMRISGIPYFNLP